MGGPPPPPYCSTGCGGGVLADPLIICGVGEPGLPPHLHTTHTPSTTHHPALIRHNTEQYDNTVPSLHYSCHFDNTATASTQSGMQRPPPTCTDGLKKVVKSWGGGAWDVGVGGCWGGTMAMYCPAPAATPAPPLPPLTYPRLILMPYKEPKITTSPTAISETQCSSLTPAGLTVTPHRCCCKPFFTSQDSHYSYILYCIDFFHIQQILYGIFMLKHITMHSINCFLFQH